MIKATPALIRLLRDHLGEDPVLEDALSRDRPDLTEALLRAAASQAPLDRDLTAAICRAGCAVLRERHPGASIEVRVPPYAAVQIGFGAGPRHTRGTPPNVVEIDPATFVALISGRLTWQGAPVKASGVHAGEVAAALPLTTHGCDAPVPTE